MCRTLSGIAVAVSFAVIADAAVALASDVKASHAKPRLDSTAGFEVVDGSAEVVSYRGRRALHLVPPPGKEKSDGAMVALLTGSDFKDGTIEIDVAGAPRPGSAENMRGFIGVAFRAQPHGSPSELIYLRPANARIDDQLVRNHATQYVSDPDYGWKRLREESPGVYEAYADLETGAWTKMKIVVSGTHAALYVGGATQPCLIVKDLKRGESHGQIGLWAHDTTEAYFANLTIR
jgi:Domain of Unknown Function (DUF1080)